MGPYFDFVKILQGEDIYSQALGLRSLKLKTSRVRDEALVSKERFSCSWQESFVVIKYSKLSSMFYL